MKVLLVKYTHKKIHSDIYFDFVPAPVVDFFFDNLMGSMIRPARNLISGWVLLFTTVAAFQSSEAGIQ